MNQEARVWLAAGLLSAIGAMQACATSKPANKPESPSCTPEAAAEQAAGCYLRVKTECVEKGVKQEDCKVIAECDAAADARLKECRK